MAENVNLTGKWIIKSQSDEVPYESFMELGQHDNKVTGMEVGGETEYFLEGNIVGNGGTIRYRGRYGEYFTGTYEFEIKDGGKRLRGYYVDDSDPAKIPWEATKDRP